MNSWRIKIQRAAKEDLRSGYEFYNAQEFGLGNYFYDCLMSDIDALAYYGGVHRQYHGFYKALSSRFPYAIYYKLTLLLLLARLAPKVSMEAVRAAWARGLSVTVLEDGKIVSVAPDGTRTFVKELDPL